MPRPSPDRLDFAHLEARGIRFVRVWFVDLGGQVRCEAIRTGHARKLVEEGVGFVDAVPGLPAFGDVPQVEGGLGPVGQVWLVADPETLRPVPWQEGYAAVTGSFVSREDEPWRFCARASLERAVEALREQGLRLEAAFEAEFTLLERIGDGDPSWRPVDRSNYASAGAFDERLPLLDAIVQALEMQELRVESFLVESGDGQFEIAIEHAPVLQAADRHAILRETVKAIAAESGHRATFLPKIEERQAGSGAHCHFSLWRDDENVTSLDGDLSPVTRHFLAGVLAHLPALVALAAPTSQSHRRLGPGSWSGAFAAWGFDNKEAPIRVPTRRHGLPPSNVEWKTPDSTANLHLALAGLIHAGLDGIRRSLPLPEPCSVDPGSLSDEARTEAGIVSLPGCVDEALDTLERDEILQDGIGRDLLRAHAALRRADAAATADWSIESEVRRFSEVW